MKKSDINAIVMACAYKSDEQLEKEYYDAVYDSLGSRTDEMYERGYDLIDIEERAACEKCINEKAKLLGSICAKRGIELWKNEKKEHQELDEETIGKDNDIPF